jgi:hypothetical protein
MILTNQMILNCLKIRLILKIHLTLKNLKNLMSHYYQNHRYLMYQMIR